MPFGHRSGLLAELDVYRLTGLRQVQADRLGKDLAEFACIPCRST